MFPLFYFILALYFPSLFLLWIVFYLGGVLQCLHEWQGVHPVCRGLSSYFWRDRVSVMSICVTGVCKGGHEMQFQILHQMRSIICKKKNNKCPSLFTLSGKGALPQQKRK